MAKVVVTCMRPNMTAFATTKTKLPFSTIPLINCLKISTKSNFTTTNSSNIVPKIPTIWIWSSDKYYHKRSISSISNTPHFVNDSGSIDSPLINSMQTKREIKFFKAVKAMKPNMTAFAKACLIEAIFSIKEQLNAESVIVKDAYGDGRHVSIDVIASVFEGQSAVSRQRMVYKAIWEELQNTVHAVDQMTTKTPDEAAMK